MAEYKAGPRKRAPTHPGAIIAGELKELDVTPYAMAKAIGISKQAIGKLLAQKLRVTPDIAVRIGKYFGNGPELWMNLQRDYDLWHTTERLSVELKAIEAIKPKAPKPKSKKRAAA